MALDKRIHLGTVIAAHGIKGDVKIKSFCDDPAALADYGTVYSEDGTQEYKMTLRSVLKDIVIASLSGVKDRDSAEALAKAKAKLFVARAKLGKPKKGQYFFEDLKGLQAVTQDGKPAGRVTDVQNFGAGDILVLADGGREFMLPLKAPFAEKIDIKAGTLQVFIPEGWLETKAEKKPQKKGKND